MLDFQPQHELLLVVVQPLWLIDTQTNRHAVLTQPPLLRHSRIYGMPITGTTFRTNAYELQTHGFIIRPSVGRRGGLRADHRTLLDMREEENTSVQGLVWHIHLNEQDVANN